MKTIKYFSIFSTIIFSLNSFASINEISAITLKSDEVIFPIHDILKVNRGTLNLFDGRSINTSQIKNLEIKDSNGDSKIISKGFNQFISVDRAGGDNSGGG